MPRAYSELRGYDAFCVSRLLQNFQPFCGAVVFWTLIITFFVKLISELLNLKAADAKLPF